MVANILIRANKRLRPAEGWLAFLLLATAVGLLVVAVNEVGWVPEAGVVTPAAVCGLLLGAALAKRPSHPALSWLLLLAYALLLPTLLLAQLLPPWGVLRGGAPAVRDFWLQNGAFFWDRMASWFVAVFGDGRSQETVVFAFTLGLGAFLLAAFAAWTTFRHQRPLPGLVLLGLALAVNNYYGTVEIWWTAFFIGIAALLTAVINVVRLEMEWNSGGIDYPEDVRLELAAYAALLATFILAFALLLPGFSISRVQAWFASLGPVSAAEETLEEAFGGVAVPRQSAGTGPGGVGGGGLMPRQYLLGDAPELYETIMMTAVVSVESDGQSLLAPPALLRGAHWRALSYDVYTGRGWAISEERADPTDPLQTIPISPAEGQSTFIQSVYWQHDERLIRYTIGLPIRFDQATTVYWRGLNDLARVRGPGNTYQVTSRLTTAPAAALRQAALADVPPALLARYTALPPNFPDAVSELAREVAASHNNPYDQARALEIFLRQYPYSLAVPSPPPDVDPVSYFLFELQAGYCDYYASSMVVMARSLGLPARLAVGYLAQPPDDNGVQTIRQVNGHSWAEIYFAGYGWVEFEPTAAFTSPRDTPASALAPGNGGSAYEPPFTDTAYTPPPIPAPAPTRPFPWFWLWLLLPLAGALGWWWRRRQAERRRRADGVLWVYGRVQQNAQKLGQPPAPSQTPQEFSAGFLAWLEAAAPGWRWAPKPESLRPPLQQITELYNRRRYAGQVGGGQEEAWRVWQKLKRPLRRLRFTRHIP